MPLWQRDLFRLNHTGVHGVVPKRKAKGWCACVCGGKDLFRLNCGGRDLFRLSRMLGAMLAQTPNTEVSTFDHVGPLDVELSVGVGPPVSLADWLGRRAAKPRPLRMINGMGA